MTSESRQFPDRRHGADRNPFSRQPGGDRQGQDLMPTLFLGFFAVIIALQVVPAMMLFRFLFKEIFRRTPARRSRQRAGKQRTMKIIDLAAAKERRP